MSPSEIANHAIHGVLSQINAAETWPEVLDVTPNTNQAWLLQRIFQFAGLIRQRLAATPATMISLAGLDQINATLARSLADLTSFKSSPNDTILQGATDVIDQIGYAHLWALPVIGANSEIGVIADRFYEQTQGALGRIEARVSDTTQDVETVSAELESVKGQINTALSEFTQQKAEAAATTAGLKRDFAVVETEFREKYGTVIEEQKTTFSQFQEEQKAAASSLVNDIEGMRKEAAKIVQIVGNIGVTGNYQKIAKSEAVSAEVWRGITLVVFVVAALYGGFTLWEFGKTTIDWPAALVRMLFSGIVASIAFYTGRESAHHRSNADLARSRELELASLGPFIESLAPERRNEIREKLVERYFGRDIEPHTVNPMFTSKDLAELAGKSIDGMKDLATEIVKRKV